MSALAFAEKFLNKSMEIKRTNDIIKNITPADFFKKIIFLSEFMFNVLL
jgi:hypothetical protein